MWRPRVEVPEFTRCCFCIPLRYGLLSIAYIKIAIVTMFAIFITCEVYGMTHYRHASRLVLPIIVVVMLWMDVVLTITFVVAGHMKNPRIMKIYYYYSIVLVVLVFLGFSAATIDTLIRSYGYLGYMSIWLLQDILLEIAVISVQMYLILLIRSELEKLKNSSNFRFVNNQAELVAADKSDSHAILQEGQEQEHTESGIDDSQLAYIY